MAFNDCELINHKPVVVVGIVKVDEPGMVTGNRAIGPAILDFYSVYNPSVEFAVVSNEGRGVRMDELAKSFFKGFIRDVRVKLDNGITKPL